MKKWLLIFLGLCLVSLAGVHFFAPALIENNFNRHLNHPTFAVSENAQKLHNTLFVAHLHSDSMLWKRNFLEESQRGHMDLPRLIKGNVALQIFAATTDEVFPLASVTTRVTTFGPTFSQVNIPSKGFPARCSALVAIPQISALPLSISSTESRA